MTWKWEIWVNGVQVVDSELSNPPNILTNLAHGGDMRSHLWTDKHGKMQAVHVPLRENVTAKLSQL